jgi:6-phosphogluconolactonase
MATTLGSVAALAAALAMAATALPATAATFVYVGCTDSNEIHVLQLNPQNGDLTPVEKVTIPGITKTAGSTPMAISPDKKFLFAATRGEPMVAASFRIDPATGKLSHIANGPLDGSMAYIATDRSGRFLLAASYPNNKVTVNPIAPDGTVQPPKQIVPTEPNAHAIQPDASNRFVLATSLGGNLVKQFRFDAATGTLSPNDPPAAPVKAGAGPRHFAFHPTNGRVYLLNELEASVYVFAYDPKTGTLKELQVVGALPEKKPEKIWAADEGTLAPIGHTATEQQPRGFAIDPTGRYLLAVGQLSDSMTSYAIDPASGKLTKLKQYPMGKNPNWVEIVNLP